MNSIFKSIIENSKNGKISKEVSSELICRLKELTNIKSDKNSEIRDIAVIGMAVNLPGAGTLDELWNNLVSGQDLITNLPDSRRADAIIATQALHPEIIHPDFYAAAFLEHIDQFDQKFFKLSQREATLMDPYQRFFLQVAYNALEDAGYGGQSIEGSRTGVFFGYSGDFGEEYRRIIQVMAPERLGEATVGNIKSLIGSRLSFRLDLKGPSLLVDTACSSSLSAVHLACRSIKSGECEMALVGSVKLRLVPLVEKDELGIVSASARTRTFDSAADGIGRGEGALAVLLKPLSHAIRDKDHVYGVIKGSAMNNDGSSIGITAPNALAQEQLLLDAWKDADIDPASISYLEAHGTGTPLGDSIEIEGIRRAFSRFTERSQFCGIGSVKTNFGHLDNAAGMISIVKACLSLKNRIIPPSLHFNKPNPKLKLSQSPVYWVDRAMDWTTGNSPRRCGVSAFGLSGTNCHIVLEEAPGKNPNGPQSSDVPLFLVVSGKSKTVLDQRILELERYLFNHPDLSLESICHTAAVGRAIFPYRMLLRFETYGELITGLRDFPKGNHHRLFYGHHRIYQTGNPQKLETDLTLHEIDLLGRLCRQAFQDKNWDQFCQSFVKGGPFDWGLLYPSGRFNKVSIPGYPFEKARFWIRSDEQDGKYSFTQTYSPKTRWTMGEHIVGAHFTTVGTDYLEKACQISREKFGQFPFEISNLAFVSPMACSREEAILAEIQVRPAGGSYEMEVRSSKGQKTISHVEALLSTFSGHTEVGKTQAFLEAKGRCLERIEANVSVKDIQVGARWKNRKSIHKGIDEWVVIQEVSEEYINEIGGYILHPALMDSAVNAVSQRWGQHTYLPFSYRSIKVFNSLGPKNQVWIRKTSGFSGAEAISFNIDIFNEHNSLIVAIENYTIKRTNLASKSAAVLEGSQRTWLDVNPREHASPSIQNTMFVEDGSPSADEFINVFYQNQNVNPVRVNQNDPLLIRKILDGLTTQKHSRIAYFVCDPTEFHLEALFRFIKVLQNSKVKHSVEIVILTFEDNPFGAAMQSLVLAAAKEHPLWKGRAISLEKGSSFEAEVGELACAREPSLVAYRKGKSFSPVLRPITVPVQTSEEQRSQLRSEGFYLISGGTGALGLEVARSLTKVSPIRIGLISRSGMQSETVQQAIEEMIQSGSDVEVCSVDVADREALEIQLRFLKQKWGRINGIIHAAGVAGSGFLMLKSQDRFNEVVRPKISGARWLHELTVGDTPDFFILFSSVSSQLQRAGQADYAAANSFLDAFAEWRKRTTGMRTLSIQWPAWKKIGMAAAFGSDGDDQEFEPIEPERGVDWLLALLSSNHSLIVASRMNENRIGPSQSKSLANVSLGECSFSNQCTDQIENTLFSAVSQILGTRQIGLYESFNEYGGDSIFASRLWRSLNKIFPGIVDVTDIFTYSSIGSLAKYIRDKINSAPTSGSGGDEFDELVNALMEGRIDVSRASEVIAGR